MSRFIDTLQTAVDAEWDKIRQGAYWALASQKITPQLYRETLLQIYHYTKHNAINQAVATYKTDQKNLGLLRFMLKHASEELGHENMAKRDLINLGLATDADFEQQPLPATQALISYLYSVALEQGGIARLGYSFWAEGSYHQFASLLANAQNTLKLTPENMTFFIAHSTIDAKHADEVNTEIERWAQTPEQQEAVKNVAVTSLYLTGCLLNQIAERLQEQESAGKLSNASAKTDFAPA